MATMPNQPIGNASVADPINHNFAARYRKIDDLEDHQRESTTRRRGAASRAVYLLIALTVALGLFLAVVVHKSKSTTGSRDGDMNRDPKFRLAEAITTVCGVTRFPAECAAGLKAFNQKLRPDPEALLTASMEVAAAEVGKLVALPESMESSGGDPMSRSALEDCVGFFAEAERQVKECTAVMAERKKKNAPMVDDVVTWLSAAITNQESCLDGLDEARSTAVGVLRGAVNASMVSISNSLAILNNIDSLLRTFSPTSTLH